MLGFWGVIVHKNVSILKFFFDIRCHSVPHEKCRQGLVVQKAEALTDDAEKAVRGSNLDHRIPPPNKCENTTGNSKSVIEFVTHFGVESKKRFSRKIYGTILRDFDLLENNSMHCLGCFFYPTAKPPEKYHQNSKLAALVASGLMMDRWIGGSGSHGPFSTDEKLSEGLG